jgi:hypothetical protein
MGSVYLQSSDYDAYGVASSTTAAQVTQASTVIDSYLQRPEGLIWMPDANGAPAYMQSLAPTITLVSTGSISPGVNVNVTVTGPVVAVQVGFVAILNKSNSEAVEACSIVAIAGNVITLTSVQFSHDAGCTLDFGLTIFETLSMPQNRPLTRLSRFPVLNLLSGQGRYGYTRRGASPAGVVDQYNLLATITKFGGPPVWEPFDVTVCSITDPYTANLWIPAGVLIAYYSEIRVNYAAGWQYTNLPSDIKQSCANILNASLNAPIFGNMKMMKAGDTALERATSTYLDDDTKNMLAQYRARSFV